MATTSIEAAQSPPRKRARLSLKLVRKDQQASKGVTTPIKEEPEHAGDNSQPKTDVSNDVTTTVVEPQSSSIPSEYVISVAPYTGLHNLGNTCYLNSVLQVLRYCPSFSENLASLSDLVSQKLKMKEEEAEEDGDDERSKRRRKEFINQLKLVKNLNKLFSTMSEKEKTYLDRMMPAGQELAMYPEDILEAIRELNSMFKGYLQHDAQELLCCILSNVQEACQGLGELQQQSVDSASNDPVIMEKSGVCMKAVRRLDMGGAGDGVAGETGCGGLLGGGRPLGGARPKSEPTLSEKKLDCRGVRGDGLVTPEENGFGGHCNGVVRHEMNGESIKLCNGNIIGTLGKSGERLNGTAQRHPGDISPSSDSVRRRAGRKSNLTNGHLSEKECNGVDGSITEANGSGDCGVARKKRLGVGRLPFQQCTLSKFGITKKDRAPSVDDMDSHYGAPHHLDAKSDSTSAGDYKESTSTKAATSRNVTSNNSNDSDQSGNTSQASLKIDNGKEGMERLEGKGSQEATKEDIVPTILEEDTKTAGASVIPKPTVASTSLPPMPRDIETSNEEKANLDVVSLASEMKVIERLFQGTLVLQTRCLECESCSEKRENFQDVSVPVQSIPAFTSEEDQEDNVPDVNPRNLSLSWALSEFTSVERLTDDNKYFCEHCFHLTEAERSVLFGRLPGVLIIQLKRFSAFINCFSPGGSVSKVNDHLAIPLSLSLAKWCSGSCQQKDTSYELAAVVAHSGSSSSSGHYIAYARVPHRTTGDCADHQPREESWAKFDDDRVQVLSDEDFESLLNPLQGDDAAATPYLLLYKDTRQIRR